MFRDTAGNIVTRRVGDRLLDNVISCQECSQKIQKYVDEEARKIKAKEKAKEKRAAARLFFGRSIAWLLLIGSIVALFTGIVGIITFARIPENNDIAVLSIVIAMIATHLLVFNSFIFFRIKKKNGLRVFGLVLMILWSFFLFMLISSQYRFFNGFNYSGVSMTLFFLASALFNLLASIFAFANAREKKTNKLLRFINFLFVVGIVLALGFGNFSGKFDFYKETNHYSEGLAVAEFGNMKSRKFGFIDQSRKEVIPFVFSEVLSFSEGLAAVKKDKWGFIDNAGNEIIPLKYDAVESFSEGLAAVSSNGKWGFIDKTGRVSIPLKYDGATSFSYGYARVGEDRLLILFPPLRSHVRYFAVRQSFLT